MIEITYKRLINMSFNYLNCYKYYLLKKSVNFNPLEAYLIFCSPRGGSTWLSEMINLIPGTSMLWEPLHLRYVNEVRDLGFCWDQYIPDTQDWPEAHNMFCKLFSGKILNQHILQYTQHNKIKKAEKLIIKFTRANALLPWLNRNFIFKNKPVYMIRHPFAVVASQLDHPGWGHIPFITSFTIPDVPYNEHYKKHKSFLERLSYKDEIHAATWCLSNMVPLQHVQNNIDWITINYEDLVLKPKLVMKRIFDEWNVNIDEDELEVAINTRSNTTRFGTPVKGMVQLANWRKVLSKEQVRRIQSVLEYFNVTCYCADNDLPQITYN
ncbi:MAG: sulfotransferase domain-containing protein [Candidatus Scalindua sp.]